MIDDDTVGVGELSIDIRRDERVNFSAVCTHR
jgi:hypothetical protein